MDWAIRGAALVTCDAEDRVESGAIVWRDGRIVALGRDALRSARRPSRVIDAPGCAVLPGLVQAHVHLAQTLMRGMADDLPLLSWLRDKIWPLEAAHDERSLQASAELGLLEASLAGTTTLLDMGTVHGHGAVMDCCARSGLRVISGKAMMDLGDGVPKGLRESTRDSLRASEALCSEWHGAEGGRVGYAFAPRFVLSCSDKLLRGAVDRAAAAGALVHTHAAEQIEERNAVRAARGDDDIAVLRRAGISGARAVLAHGVQITDDEARQIAADGTRIVHCPSSNLKLGSGIARIAALDAFGVQLALGADGAPCNNNLDPWIELRLCALLSKVVAGPTSLPARRALRLLTIDGARALGLGHVTGSLEVGKAADLVVVRVDGPHAEPGGDLFSRLVYATGARDVTDVFVAGRPIVRGAEHCVYDREEVTARARVQGAALRRRAGQG